MESHSRDPVSPADVTSHDQKKREKNKYFDEYVFWIGAWSSSRNRGWSG